MNPEFMLQLHTHSERSHDSNVPIKKYVNYLEKNLSKNQYAIIAFTDHNVIPLTLKEAIDFSTKKVLVLPGIEWSLHQSFFQGIKGLCAKREVITIGNHDGLRKYIDKNTKYRIFENDEILGKPTEKEFLRYIIKNQEKMIIIPHPKHFVVDFYGKRQIKKFNNKMEYNKINCPLFIEEKTGYDPFPRISRYKHKYPVVGGSDAHEIKSIFGTESIFAVETFIEGNPKILKLWHKSIKKKDTELYKKTMRKIFRLIKEKNKEIIIKKHYLISTLQFLGTVPRWTKRRFSILFRKIRLIKEEKQGKSTS